MVRTSFLLMSLMVKPRKFLPEDYIQLEGWSNDREVKAPPLEYLPSTGYIVDGVACGFLYLTNSAVGLLEGFITNPNADKNDRNKALDSITLKLIELAELNSCKILKCETKIDAIVNRAKDFGFTELIGFKTLMKEI